MGSRRERRRRQPGAHLRAAGQGVEKVEEHKAGEGHGRGAWGAGLVRGDLEQRARAERVPRTRPAPRAAGSRNSSRGRNRPRTAALLGTDQNLPSVRRSWSNREHVADDHLRPNRSWRGQQPFLRNFGCPPPPHPSRNLAQLKGLSLPPAGDIASWKVTVLQPRPLSRTSLPPGRQGTETHRGSGRGHPLPGCGAGLGPGATGETDSHPHLSFPLPGELEVNPSCLGLSARPGFSPDSPGGAGVRARLWSPGGGCPRIWISYKVPEGRRLGWRPCAEGRCVSPGGPGSPSPPGGAHRLDGGRDPHLPWHVRIWERARLLLWG